MTADQRVQIEARQQAWVRALSQDEVPSFVEQRIRAAAARAAPWLSTMTPAELLISRRHGLTPVATVSGTCALQYGSGQANSYVSDEWVNLGLGWDRAVARLKGEARAAGANAVIDVHMRSLPVTLPGSAEFTVIGTAVKVERLAASTDPVIATVSAMDFVRLLEMDIVVCGIALGTAYDWIYTPFGMTETRPGGRDRARRIQHQLGTFKQSAPVQELTDFWENVRRQAHQQLKSKAQSIGNGLLARTNYGQLIKVGTMTPNYIGRHMVIGTVLDCGPSGTSRRTSEIKLVSDLRGSGSISKAETSTPTENCYDALTDFLRLKRG